MHSTCTRKPTESHQTLPSPCVILKAIRAGVGWVWLARLLYRTSDEHIGLRGWQNNQAFHSGLCYPKLQDKIRNEAWVRGQIIASFCPVELNLHTMCNGLRSLHISVMLVLVHSSGFKIPASYRTCSIVCIIH